jgi:hypothetical protein
MVTHHLFISPLAHLSLAWMFFLLVVFGMLGLLALLFVLARRSRAQHAYSEVPLDAPADDGATELNP